MRLACALLLSVIACGGEASDGQSVGPGELGGSAGEGVGGSSASSAGGTAEVGGAPAAGGTGGNEPGLGGGAGVGAGGAAAGAGGLVTGGNAGTGGEPSGGGTGGATETGGTGGVVVDPLAPYPAPDCPGYTAYRIPFGTCIHVHGRFRSGAKSYCPNDLANEPPVKTCAVSENVGQCSPCANPTQCQACEGEYLTLYVQAEDGRAYAADRYELDTATGLCPELCD